MTTTIGAGTANPYGRNAPTRDLYSRLTTEHPADVEWVDGTVYVYGGTPA